jgi:hypothetical protein
VVRQGRCLRATKGSALTIKGKAFAIVPLAGIVFFAVVVVIAIGTVRRPGCRQKSGYPTNTPRNPKGGRCWL